MALPYGPGDCAYKTPEQNHKRFNKGSVSGVNKMDTSTSTMLTEKFIQYYNILREEFKRRTGKYPNEYREDIDREGIEGFFQEFEEDNKTIKEISIGMLSELVSLQALPNMNHRTTLVFTRIFLLANDVYFYEYEERTEEYHRFAEESKSPPIRQYVIWQQQEILAACVYVYYKKPDTNN